MGQPVGGKPSAKRRPSGERSQSEVVGVILIFGLVMAGSFAILALGATAIGDTEQKLSGDRAEKTLTQFDSKAGLVALDGADSQSVSFPTGEQFKLDEDAGQIRVTVQNLSSGDTWDDPILNETLGAVTYETDGTKIAYQGGGVWRETEKGGSMISPPEFHYRDETLVLPAVLVRGEGSLGNQATVNRVSEDETGKQIFPINRNENKTNPLDDHLVSLVIESEYYKAWGSYFEERTDGSVDYPAPNTVRLNLTTPTDGTTVDGPLIANDNAVTTEFKAKADVDSYDSSVGDYDSTGGGGVGTIYHAGELDFKNGAELNGSLVIEEELQMKKNAKIKGDLTHGNKLDLHSSPSTHVDGAVKSGAEVPEPDPVDSLIKNKVNELDSNNDNAAHSTDINNLENKNTCAPCELTQGSYYLDNMDLADGDTLELKPNGGTIEIAIEDDMILQNSATIEVIGDGKVEIYADKNLDMRQSSEITNNGDNAPQFWIYIKSDRSATLKNSASYTGVIYGPESGANPGTKVNLKKDAQVFGSVVGKLENVNNDASIHYDEALGSTSVFEDGENVIPVTYLHITKNEISIDD